MLRIKKIYEFTDLTELNFLNKGTIFVISFTFVCGIFIVIQLFLKNLIRLSLIIFITVISDVLIIIIGINEYRKRRKTLRLTSSGLKNYETYDILTDKRYIRRNYSLNFNKNFDFSIYPSNALKITDNNILILSLELITKIILDKSYKNLHFLVKNEKGEDATDVYIHCLDSEIDEIINILTIILKFQEKERYSYKFT